MWILSELFLIKIINKIDLWDGFWLIDFFDRFWLINIIDEILLNFV